MCSLMVSLCSCKLLVVALCVKTIQVINGSSTNIAPGLLMAKNQVINIIKEFINL